MGRRLGFFHALNPAARTSGIFFIHRDGLYSNSEVEMLDTPVSQALAEAFFRDDLNFLAGLQAAYSIIVGDHYDFHHHYRGQKGLLDYLIFPLVARKLIGDTYLPERDTAYLTNAIAWAIAIPLEVLRFGSAFALTLLTVPLVSIVHLTKNIINCVKPPESALYQRFSM